MAVQNIARVQVDAHRTRPAYVCSKGQWLVALSCIAVALSLYSIAIWRTFPATATDVGGDYAYVAWRIGRGAMLYRDVLGQQTPLLYLLGAAAYRLWPRPDVFLAIALGTRALTALAVLGLARACRFPPVAACVATLIYLLLPMGFFFGARFEPNILIALGGVLATLALTDLSPRRAVLAGLICGLSVMAKLTFAPIVLAFALYLLVTRRSLLWPFVVSTLGVLLIATGVGITYAGPDFIEGAYLAHVGSTLSGANLVMSMRYVWRVEGLTVLAALVGALLAARQAGSGRLLALYLLGGIATLGATVSVGSLAPEMLAGEPAIALCATFAVQRAVTAWNTHYAGRRIFHQSPFVLVVVLLVVGQALAVRNDALALREGQPSARLGCLLRALQNRDHRAGAVVAPAYAAFLAQRPLVAGLSDLFNWSIRVRRGDQTAQAQVKTVLAAVSTKHIAVIAFDSDDPLPPQVERAVVTS